MKNIFSFLCLLFILLSCKKDDDLQIKSLTGEWQLVKEEIHRIRYLEPAIDSFYISTNRISSIVFYNDSILVKDLSDTIEYGKYEVVDDTINLYDKDIVKKFQFKYISDTLVINERHQIMTVKCVSYWIDYCNGILGDSCSLPVLTGEKSINRFYLKK